MLRSTARRMNGLPPKGVLEIYLSYQSSNPSSLTVSSP